ncbi:MAG: TonB-dependent receptor [Desulfobacteraceae bacterium]|nr:TonB-dependent receptor [Desulfobacteraceae bacterium]
MVLAFLVTGRVGAETQKDYELPEYVVTASRNEKRTVDVPVRTQVIIPGQIELSGVVDLGDLIGKYVTGHMHKFSGMSNPVGLRGLRSESHGDDVKGYVLILVDGHRMGTGNAAKISVDRIDRVEVVKGPASALYGSAAIGGVVNVITKKGSGTPETTLAAEYGSFDYRKGRISSGGEWGDRLAYHFTASTMCMDDFQVPEYGRVHNSSENQSRVGGNFTFSAGENHEFRLGGNYAELKGEYPSWAAGTYSEYDGTRSDHFDKSHGYADLEYNGGFRSGKLRWKGLGYYLWDLNHWYYRGWDGTPPNDNQTRSTDTTTGTDHQLTMKLADWNALVLGFNLEWLEKKSTAKSGGADTIPFTPGMTYETQSLFIQEELDLLENRVNISLAGRYDRFSVETKRPDTGDFESFKENTETYDHFSPKAGMGVKFFDEALRLRTNIGSGFKTPSADQLSAEYQKDATTLYRGNADLDPETSLTVDIGADFYHDLFDIGLTFFHTDFKDKIVDTTYTEGTLYVNSWKNSGDAEIEGIDLDVNWHIGRTFDIDPELLFFTRITFNTKFEDKKADTDLLYISDYEVKSGLNYSYDTFSAALSHVVVGPQKIENHDSWPATIEEKKAFSFWDLTLTYGFLGSFEAHLNITNLLDEKYEWVRGYIQPERSFRFGISYTF